MSTLSIVILNWNGKAYLEEFLPVLKQNSHYPGAEIVVADNGSTDDSVDYLKDTHPDIRLIALKGNHGFSGGYNRALETLQTDYFLLLNSDIEVTPGWLGPLMELMEKDPSVGACTSKIMDYNKRTHFEYAGASGGYIDRFGYPFCRGRIFDHLEEDRGQYDDPVEVFWGSGACLLVRAGLYREAGGLDEVFFAHMEEIDLCWRLKRMGFRICVVPGSVIYHVGGGTLERGHPMKTFLNFRNNLLLLYKNLPAERRDRVLFGRRVLDGISALRFLLQGDFKDFRAVLKAHRTFRRLKVTYAPDPDEPIKRIPETRLTGFYPRSIVFDFFLRGKKQFNRLRTEILEGT